jgi:hypothetical protein
MMAFSMLTSFFSNARRSTRRQYQSKRKDNYGC